MRITQFTNWQRSGHLSKEETRMENKQLENVQHLISLEICELKQDTTTYRRLNVQATTPSASEGVGHQELPFTAGRNAKWQQATAQTNPGEGRSDLSILPTLCKVKNDIHLILNVTENGRKEKMSSGNKLE